MAATLDFRDISEHPPSSAIENQPLPQQDGWDAYKVYFNERQDPNRTSRKGDWFDALFEESPPDSEQAKSEGLDFAFGDFQQNWITPSNTQNTASAMVSAVTNTVQNWFQSTKENSTRASDGAFDATDVTSTSITDSNGFGDATVAGLVASNIGEGEEDDLNLLRRSDEDDDIVPSVFCGDSTGLPGMVNNLFLSSSSNENKESTAQRKAPAMDKEARIQMYETTGVDDESSVEEDEGNDDEDWENGRQVDYIKQNESTAEDEVFTNINGRNTAVPDFEPIAEAEIPTFQLPISALATSSSKKKKKSSSGPLPLIRPPPPEKLKKWEDEKARPHQHLQKMKHQAK